MIMTPTTIWSNINEYVTILVNYSIFLVGCPHSTCICMHKYTWILKRVLNGWSRGPIHYPLGFKPHSLENDGIYTELQNLHTPMNCILWERFPYFSIWFRVTNQESWLLFICPLKKYNIYVYIYTYTLYTLALAQKIRWGRRPQSNSIRELPFIQIS